MDIDQIRERFAASRRDDRGPVEKFLDLLDLPRNQIMSLAAPGLESEARARGETGAFGTGRVYGSDIVKHLGIDNRIARGVLGFGLDIAFDPLTYLGPAGGAIKVTNAAGQGTRIGLRGARSIRAGIDAVKAGGLEAVKDQATRKLFDIAARSAPEGADLASHISKTVLGNPTSGRVRQSLSRVGGELSHKGGMIAENIDKFVEGGDETADAVRAFVAQYGKGSAPGIRIGKDAAGKLRVTVGQAANAPVATSTIAHIPFTEFGIHVPGFTADGKAAADALRIATASGKVDVARATSRTVQEAAQHVRDIEDASAMIDAGAFATPVEAQAHIDNLMGKLNRVVDRQDIGPYINPAKPELGRVGIPIDPAKPEHIGELLALKKLIDEGEAAAERAKVLSEAGISPVANDAIASSNQKLADATRGSIRQFARNQPDEIQRIAKRILGTDDDIIGASVLTPIKSMAAAANDPGIVADIANRIDRGGRNVFGQPNGMLRNVGRWVRNTLTTGSREVFHSTESEFRNAVLGAATDAGIEVKNGDDYEKLVNLAMAHLHRVRNAADPSEAVFFTKRFGTEDEADWVRLLQEAQKDGYFAKGSSEKLNASLSKLAGENAGLLDTLGSEEYTDNILRGKLAGYVPVVTTPEAKARIAEMANQRVAIKRAAPGVEKTQSAFHAEQFQKPRSMLQYRYKTNEGGWRRFFEKDRWVNDLSDAELNTIKLEDPDSYTRIRQLQQDIKLYDNLAENPDFAKMYAPRNTDPWELNQLVRDGAFNIMLGAEPLTTGFADTNIATAMAQRFMSHERAVARRTWLEYVKQFGVSVDPKKFQGQFKEGGDFLLKDGSVAKFWKDPNGIYGVEMLGQRYRPLQESIASLKGNPLIEAIGNTKANIYHEDVARMLEDLANVYDKDAPNLLRMADQATGAWKTATLMHPSWTVGNIVGDGLNYLMGGARIQDIAEKAPAIAKAIANADNPEALKNLTISVRGVEIPAAQFIDDLRHNRLLGNNRHAETALQLIGRKFFVMPSQLGGRKLYEDFMPATIKADFLQRLSHETAASKMKNVASATGFIARDRLMRRLIAPWFRANEKVSDYMRALAYSSFLEQGHDINSAVQRTIRSGFDYADNTRVERNLFRRLFPFYSWMRLNGAYQMKLLMERPIYAGSFPLLQNAVEEAINGDAQVPLHARPSWMRNQLAIMVGSDPNERFALALGNTLPVEQALVAGGALTGIDGIQDFAKYFLTGTTPAIRAPAEFAAGREFFTGKTIGNNADISPTEFAIQQFRPLNEAGKIGKTVSQQGVGQAAARFILGGRVQNASNDRLSASKLREFNDEEQKLRYAIRKADRNNDPSSRAVAGAKLLQMYQSMIQAGFDKEVPVWARKTLATTAGGPM